MELRVSSTKEAWGLANRLFPTSFEKDENKSRKSGIAIYRSTESGTEAYISDFGDRLVISHPDGGTETIWIELPEKGSEPSRLSYKVFITDSHEAASLIAPGFSKDQAYISQVRSSYGSTMCANLEMIPDIYKKPGKFYAMIAYHKREGETQEYPEYNLTVC